MAGGFWRPPGRATAHTASRLDATHRTGAGAARVLGALCLACTLLPVAAQGPAFRYSVELDVPEAYRKLLQDNLEIVSARDNPRMSADPLRSLVHRTPDQIRELLATEGYYSPRIESSLEQRQGGWFARFAVAPGEPSLVAGVELDLRGDIAAAEHSTRLAGMRERWPLRAGMVFRQAQWERAKRGALQSLLTGQYPAARIASSRASVDPNTRRVSLRVVLESGPAFSFGTLEVTGLDRYPRRIVERLNDIEPGSPYSQASLLELQSRLQDSRYFTAAQVSADTDPARPQRVPVRVRVVEAQSRKLGFGAGASTNTGARGQVEYQDLNFMDRAWRLSSLLKLETSKRLLSGALQFPRTAGGYTDSLTALTERSEIEGQTASKIGVGAKRARVVGNTETAFGPQFQTERQHIAGAQGESSQALVGAVAWTRRDVNNLLYPSDGLLLGAQLGVAAKSLLSDQDFVRVYGKATWYRSVGKSGGFILRGELGATLARSRRGIPSDYLFRAGGDQSVRGYAYQSLGVRSGDAIVGGRYLGVASAEYVQWVTPDWGAAVFYDAGSAADQRSDLKPVHGYGAGARWKSPVGLLKLDLAYGREVRKARLHFSVGISF